MNRCKDCRWYDKPMCDLLDEFTSRKSTCTFTDPQRKELMDLKARKDVLELELNKMKFEEQTNVLHKEQDTV